MRFIRDYIGEELQIFLYEFFFCEVVFNNQLAVFSKFIPLIFKKSKNTYDMISLICFGGLITTLANAVFIDVFEASKTAYLFWIMLGCYYQSLNLKNDSKK